MKNNICMIILALFFTLNSNLTAEIMLPTIIGKNMVIQGKQKVPIWGWARPGDKITVSFNGQEKTAVAGELFKWQVDLDPMEYSKKPLKMIISSSSGDKITLDNILIGEVWVASGQSNMEWTLRGTDRGEEFIEKSKDPLIRLYKIWRKTSNLPQITSAESQWNTCDPQTVTSFSAVLYFFGHKLRKDLDVPIGLVQSAYSGTSIQKWIPAEGYRSLKENKGFQHTAKSIDAGMQRASKPLEKSLKNLKLWTDMNQTRFKKGKILYDAPLPFCTYGSYFNAMIYPLIPYAVKGVLWYQGEANVSNNNKKGLYYNYMKALIQGWRICWKQTKLPFYYVQIAPRDYSRYAKDPLKLPQLWENQMMTLSVPDTGIASTFDVSPVEGPKPEEAHPRKKYEVGYRLALIALKKNYGKKDLVYSGPQYKSHKVENGKIRILFDHVGSGLCSRNQKALSWFTIAGKDKKFIKANAEIDKDAIIVSSPEIAEPVAVRFGWHQLAVPNLMNKEGLPAFPFRTDKWEQ